jgi:hypothetical protein
MANRPSINSKNFTEMGVLNSVSAPRVTLRSSKSKVYLLKDRDAVGLSASRSVGFSKWTVLIGRTGFDTTSSIPDPTLSLITQNLYRNGCRAIPQ